MVIYGMILSTLKQATFLMPVTVSATKSLSGQAYGISTNIRCAQLQPSVRATEIFKQNKK